MGWWSQDTEGHSFAEQSDLKWGDGPADLIDSVLDQIFEHFQHAYGRNPTAEELQAGIMFSARPKLADEVPA